MASLFNYIRQIDELFARATDEKGEIDFDSIKDDLNALEMNKAEKIDNCIAFYKSRKATAEALKKEKQAIADRQKSAENEAERMKNYLAFCLGGDKWESTAGKISYRKTERVEVTDANKIPEEYRKWSFEPDKASIKEDIKQGVIIAGATICENISTIIK